LILLCPYKKLRSEIFYGDGGHDGGDGDDGGVF